MGRSRPLSSSFRVHGAVPMAEPARRRGSPGLVLLLILILLLLLLPVAALGGAYRLWLAPYETRILPGVRVAALDLDLGGLTRAEAEDRLRTAAQRILETPLILEGPEGRLWTPSAEEIGLEVRTDEVLAAAWRVGHEGSLWERLRLAYRTRVQGYEVPLRLRLDQGRLTAYLLELKRQIDRPRREATFEITPEGEVRAEPGQEGRALVVEETLAKVLPRLERLDPGPVPLVVRTIPVATPLEALEAARARAEALLATRIDLRWQDRTWSLGRREMAGFLHTFWEETPSGERIPRVVLDEEALRRFLTEEVAPLVGDPPEDARFAVVDGEFVVLSPGRDGTVLDVDRTLFLIREGVRQGSGRIALDLPTRMAEPALTAQKAWEMGLRQVIAVGHSNYTPSPPYRIHNIKTGLARLNGVLIPPGGVFSFNETIQEISERTGFVEGWAIVGNRSVKDVGGGICQVSTTVFRAAFWAGLPIEERWAHSYRLSWYENQSVLGLDATIYLGGPDLKFRNDTPGYLMLLTDINEATGDVYVYLIGTPVPGREVELEGPVLTDWVPAPTEPLYIDDPTLPAGYVQQTDWAHDGVTATVKRIVKENGVVVREDVFKSVYKPWPNVFVRGTGGATPDEGGEGP